jgi:exosortase
LPLLGLLLVAFAPALIELGRVWDSVDYLAHGYLIPVVALWAAWREREARARLPLRRDPRGLFVVALALALYAAGLALGWIELQGGALVIAVAGGALWMLGPARTRALAFPIGFLLFMVPVPQPWIAPAIVSLRLFVTAAAVFVLHALGVPVTREGNVLLLPGGESLFVAEACSGVTSLVTLAPLAVLLAYFTERGARRRTCLVASIVPIALLGNLARVVGTVWAARVWGVQRVTAASLHESAGLVSYLLGCLALLGVGWLFRRLGRPGAP